MRFKSHRLPAQPGGGGVSILGIAGAALANELIPKIIGELTGKGQSKSVETIVDGVTSVALDLAGVETPDQALEVFQGDPELAKVARIEATKIAIAEIEADTRRQELQASEMQSARQLYQAGDNGIQKVLVGGAFLFASAGLALVGYMNVTDTEPTTLTVSIVTTSFAPLLTVFGLYFGSSIGSRRKTDVMSDEIKSLTQLR